MSPNVQGALMARARDLRGLLEAHLVGHEDASVAVKAKELAERDGPSLEDWIWAVRDLAARASVEVPGFQPASSQLAAGGLPASTPGLGQLDLALSPLVPLVLLQSAGPRMGPSLPAAGSAETPGLHGSARDGPAPKLVAQGSPAGPYTERCRGHAQARAS
jgi:hypothetical protein